MNSIIKNCTFALILSFIITVFTACSNDFDMEADGSLDYIGSDSSDVVEISREYDGKASGFSDTGCLYGRDFRYDGTLKQFLKYHAWIFSQNYKVSEDKMIYCNDYSVEFNTVHDNLGVDFVETNNGKAIIYVKYWVMDRDGHSEVASFENLSDLRNWVQ